MLQTLHLLIWGCGGMAKSDTRTQMGIYLEVSVRRGDRIKKFECTRTWRHLAHTFLERCGRALDLLPVKRVVRTLPVNKKERGKSKYTSDESLLMTIARLLRFLEGLELQDISYIVRASSYERKKRTLLRIYRSCIKKEKV